MSAIETCRTAVMGGHVEACTDCGHWRIACNSCRNRHCPRCQGAAARTWLAERRADLLPVGYFHVVFTLPAEVADIAWQNKGGGLRPAVPGRVRDHDDHRGRPKAPRRPHRHHRGPAHLGLGHDPPPAHPHNRARRRPVAGRQALGVVTPGVPAAEARTRQAVPPPVPDPADVAPRCGPPRLLRQPRPPCRLAYLFAAPSAGPKEALGRLRQAALRRA